MLRRFFWTYRSPSLQTNIDSVYICLLSLAHNMKIIYLVFSALGALLLNQQSENRYTGITDIAKTNVIYNLFKIQIRIKSRTPV